MYRPGQQAAGLAGEGELDGTQGDEDDRIMFMFHRELYDLPWDRRRFSLHRARVQSAGPRIDCTPPSSAGLMHVRDKRKKDQQEKERQAVIQVIMELKMIITNFSYRART